MPCLGMMPPKPCVGCWEVGVASDGVEGSKNVTPGNLRILKGAPYAMEEPDVHGGVHASVDAGAEKRPKADCNGGDQAGYGMMHLPATRNSARRRVQPHHRVFIWRVLRLH